MQKTAIFAFAFIGVVWGAGFIFVKWAAETITPAQIVLLRVVFGFIPILIFAFVRGELRINHWRHAHHFLVMSVLAMSFCFYAIVQGTVRLPSSVAGMLTGAVPLFTFVCSFLFSRDEPINVIKAAGIGLGFLGVLLIGRPWSATGTISPVGVTWMVAGSVSFGCSFVYARKFVKPLELPSMAVTTYQSGIAMLTLLPITPLEGIGALFTDTRAALAMIVGLGFLGTGLTYISYYYIVERLGAVVAASVTYIPPVVAIIIGVLFVGEPIAPTGYLAMVLILTSVAILQMRAVPRANGAK